jgi:hypothetical protein
MDALLLTPCVGAFAMIAAVVFIVVPYRTARLPKRRLNRLRNTR